MAVVPTEEPGGDGLDPVEPTVAERLAGGPDRLGVVVITDRPWGSVGCRDQHLISALVRDVPGTRALFVSPPGSPWARGGARLVRRQLRPVTDVAGLAARRLWSFEPATWWPAHVDRRADERFVEAVQRATVQVGITAPVLWVSAPHGAKVLAATGWPCLYDIPPDPSIGVDGLAGEQTVTADEEFLLTEAAQTVACSPVLAEVAGSDAAVLANAADAAALRAPAHRPADLPPGPVAVYVGAVDGARLDLDLCADTARDLAGRARVVLVGPVSLSRHQLDGLREAGVIVLGPRPYRDVPGYLQHADVLLAPYRQDGSTDQLDPCALYEYQAVGRPVVATAVPATRARENIVVAEADFYAETARELLADLPPTRPVAVAQWSDRAAQAATLLAQHS